MRQFLLRYISRRLIFLAVFILVIFYAVVNYINNFPQELRVQERLSIPQISRVLLPGPLQLPLITSNVLGYQDIDPKDIIKFVNIERAKKKIKPLKINPILTKAAQMRADVILKYQNFSHQDPYEGVELITSLYNLGYSYRYASENIGMGGVSAKNFVFGFMNSASHRENLLNPYLEETGVAVVTGKYHQYYVNIAVEMFAIPVNREQYLGYTKKEVENYEHLLGKINSQLYRANSYLKRGVGNETYYMGWKILLERQKEIISTIFDHMQREEPLFDEEIKLIKQYNENWDKAPRSGDFEKVVI